MLESETHQLTHLIRVRITADIYSFLQTLVRKDGLTPVSSFSPNDVLIELHPGLFTLPFVQKVEIELNFQLVVLWNGINNLFQGLSLGLAIMEKSKIISSPAGSQNTLSFPCGSFSTLERFKVDQLPVLGCLNLPLNLPGMVNSPLNIEVGYIGLHAPGGLPTGLDVQKLFISLSEFESLVVLLSEHNIFFIACFGLKDNFSYTGFGVYCDVASGKMNE